MKLSYSRELDGLRGLAILLVVLSHTKIAVLSGGFIGVDIFFVLSGFLITALLVQEYDTSGKLIGFRNFYLRRALRLGPALLLFLALYVTLAILFAEDWTVNATRALIALFYFSNWVQAFELYDLHVLGPTWSLSIEEQFYFLWPLMLYLLLGRVTSRVRVAAIISVFVFLSLAFRAYLTHLDHYWWRIHVGLDTRADTLLVGCLIGVALMSTDLRKILNCHRRLIGFLGIAGFAVVFGWLLAFPVGTTTVDAYISRMRQYHYWGLLLVEVGVASMILQVHLCDNGRLKSLLAWTPLVWVGKISYGIYIWHFPIFHAVFKILGSMLDLSRLEFRLPAATLAISVTVVVAVFSYRFVEAPALRMKRYFQAARPEKYREPGVPIN